MSVRPSTGRWLLGESARIAAILLAGFLLAHAVSEAIAALGVTHLYGVRPALAAALQATALVTALLYAATRTSLPVENEMQ